MSFRNTFVTDFIYQASDDVRDANPFVFEVFKKWAARLDAWVDERGYGYYAGWFKTLSGTMEEAQADLKQIIPELEQATKVPFRLVVLLESNEMITYEINPQPYTL